MYFVKTPKVIKQIFPSFCWDKPNINKEIYLTFDDGPIPEVTPWVLDQLDQYDAKATFFCVGDNVRKYPEIFEKVIEAGHNVGNHTFNHLNGWQTGLTEYVENINKCSEYVESNLFRPPYGKISRRQAQMISHHFKVVMWDVLSGDFDQTISKTTCLENVINYANSGSIVVFHDNIKSFDKLQYVLPKVLSYFSKNGYTFKSLQSAKTLKRTTELVPA